tara:strand:+ start:171 stop:656 length:486 start_codon:yes stop_codon:yes gene_type:complete
MGRRHSNDDSFREFYASARDRVAEALSATLGDASLGADAADEAMIRAYERWHRLESSSNPSGWAYRVGLNWARRRIGRSGREMLVGAPDERPVWDQHDHSAGLRAMLLNLPIDQRSVVVLRYVLDLTVDDIGAALGVPAGTVKSRLHRAHSRLAEIMEVQT